MINRKIKATLHNRFDFIREDIRTGKREQVAYAENIILDQAWAEIMSTEDTSGYTPAWFANIRVGTGTGALSAARTTLFTEALSANVETSEFNYDMDENWYSHRRRITLAPETLVGSNISEVGIGSNINSKLCTHALLKDMNGNTVTIEKTATDILYIYGTVYLMIVADYSPDLDVDFFRCHPSYNMVISGLLGLMIQVRQSGTFNDKYRSMWPKSLAVWDGEPCSMYHINPTTVGAIYNPTAYNFITVTVTAAQKKAELYFRIAVDYANSTNGVKSAALFMNGDNTPTNFAKNGLIIRYPSATLTQDPIAGEQIGIGDGANKSFATAFPFVKTGAVVKVDGSPVSATVYTGLPSVKNIAKYMKLWGVDGAGLFAPNNRFPYLTNDSDMIVENPFYASYGIDTMVVSYATVYYSDDKVNWTQGYSTGSATQTYTVNAGHKQKRYWKFAKTGATAWQVTEMNCNALDSFKNVVTDSEPAIGSIVTIDYNTDIAAKDSDHVLDVTVTIQLGEYTPT